MTKTTPGQYVKTFIKQFVEEEQGEEQKAKADDAECIWENYKLERTNLVDGEDNEEELKSYRDYS